MVLKPSERIKCYKWAEKEAVDPDLSKSRNIYIYIIMLARFEKVI